MTIGDVGMFTALLATNAGRLITVEQTYVDDGYHIMG